MASIKQLTTCLWFNGQAEEAARFYTNVFRNSKMGRIIRFGNVGQEHHHQKAGTVMTVEFELEGNHFMGLNGGPDFSFSEAISLVIHCDTQEEIDYYWNKLSEGGDPNAQVCGWLKDKFGLSWQVSPAKMGEYIGGDDQERSDRVMKEIFTMKKIDLAKMEAAYHA